VTPQRPAGLASVTVIAGSDQQGYPGDPLDNQITFWAQDTSGAGMPHIPVHVAVVTGGGVTVDTVLLTDVNGTASTIWYLGDVLGAQKIVATVAGMPPVEVNGTAAGCDPAVCLVAAAFATDIWDLLQLKTYEHSGQVVHPDVTPEGPDGHLLWMAITPYPGGNSEFENPSIYQSLNGHIWRAPMGVVNPVARPQPAAYLSDPDMVFDHTTHKLWLYYREVASGQNIIHLKRSLTGGQWDSAVTVVAAPNHQIISPAVVRSAPDAPWQMWSVNSQAQGCTARSTTVERRTSGDGVHWGNPVTTDLAQPGQVIWHIDVQWIPARSEYWALYNTYPSGNSCATNALYLARSTDGSHWQTYTAPVVMAGINAAFQDIVYRSTFYTNAAADSVHLWVSGARLDINAGYTWETQTAAFRTDDLFAALQSSLRAPLPNQAARRNLPPPEPDGPSN
jgi:hypothetical protein